MSDWTAAGALLVSIIAGAFAALSWHASHRSANVAERALVESRRAADAAAELTRLEREDRHNTYAPDRPEAVRTETRTSARMTSLFGVVTVGRDYRMKAVGKFRNGGQTDLVHSKVVRANVPEWFPIEQVPAGWAGPVVKEIEFRFWPALPGEDGDGWTCPCGKETEHLDGHWRFTVPVAPPEAEDWGPGVPAPATRQ